MRTFVEGIVPSTFTVTDEDECFFLDFGFGFVRFDDGCEDLFWVDLFWPAFVVAEEKVGYSLYCQLEFVDSILVVSSSYKMDVVEVLKC